MSLDSLRQKIVAFGVLFILSPQMSIASLLQVNRDAQYERGMTYIYSIV